MFSKLQWMIKPSTVTGCVQTSPQKKWFYKRVNKIYLVTFSKLWQFKAACKFLKLETYCGKGTFQSKAFLTKEIY